MRLHSTSKTFRMISFRSRKARYIQLQRMLKTRWLESEMGLSARQRPVRVFKLTEAGRKHLEEERSSFEKSSLESTVFLR